MNSFTCNLCTKLFSLKSNLRRHLQNIHKGNSEEKYLCEKCSKFFSTKGNLDRHSKTCRQQKTGRVCPICKITSDHLDDHFLQDHGLKIEHEKLNFETLEDFNVWKHQMEKETQSRYISMTSKKTKGNLTFYYYYCHRNGPIRHKGKNIRRTKSLGTNKIIGRCPAKIAVKETNHQINETNSKKITVTYTKTHVGHEIEMGRIPLLKSDRIALAEKISAKVPFDEILNQVRENAKEDDFERLHLLTKKDLFNIQQSFNLKKESIRHPNDCLNVTSWVEQTRKLNGDNLVRFFKNQGELDKNFPELEINDFLLVIMSQAQLGFLVKYGNDSICIDSTHGHQAYNFQLTTLLVLDELRQGFPCIFVFSNRNDVILFKIVFSILKDILNTRLKPKVFMSDMANSFYPAWTEVMGPVQFHLYCTWHVDEAWKKNIKLKIKNKEDRNHIMKALRVLLKELDIETFQQSLKKFLDKSETCAELEDFLNYFKTYYLDCKKQWAYCYRQHTGLNTNMDVENMHRTIKHINLKAKTVKRLDKVIDALLKFMRNKLSDHLDHTNVNKGKLPRKMRKLQQNHKEMLKFETVPSVVPLDKEKWLISSTTSQEMYTIKVANLNCECALRCEECRSCIHAYVCSCSDSKTRGNMCKHIHFFCTSTVVDPVAESSEKTIVCEDISNDFLSYETVVETSPEVVICEDIDNDFLVKEDPRLSEQKNISKNLQTKSETLEKGNWREKLQVQFDEILNEVTSEEHYQIVKQALDQVLPAFSRIASCDKQKGFKSTKLGRR